MGFDAADIVEPLDYNFDTLARRYPGLYPALDGVSGTVPEPSDEMVQRFQRDFAGATADLIPEGVDTNDRAALARVMRDMDDAVYKKSEDALLDALAALTRGQPTREQMGALPYRMKREFIKWLTNELMNPESSTVVSTPSLAIVNDG